MLGHLTTEVKEHRNDMKTSIKNIEEKISNISLRVSANEKDLKNFAGKTETNIEDILANKNEIETLKDSVEALRNDNAKLTKSLDDQIDRNMRETLIFGGVNGVEKSWEETKTNLAKLLTKLEEKKVEHKADRYSFDDFYYGIVRAHRGAKGKYERQIYAKFSSQQMVEHIKTLAFVDKNIFINQMRSPLINERLYNGRKHIRLLKADNESKTWKMFMNDRCQLMHKKDGADKYTVLKQF